MSVPPGHSENGRLSSEGDREADERLVAAIRAARTPDELRCAWHDLLAKFQPMMLGLCRQMLGPKRPAEDACHEALVRVMQGLHTFDDRSRVSTWIYRVTLNACLSHIRKESRNEGLTLDSRAPGGPGRSGKGSPGTLGEFLPQSREPIPGGRVEQEDQRALVTEALGFLDPDLRSVLLLRDAQGLDYAQIAELLEVRVGTIKSRIFRARLALRQAVESVRAGRLGPSEARGHGYEG